MNTTPSGHNRILTRSVRTAWLFMTVFLAATSWAGEITEFKKYCDKCKRWMPSDENCDCWVRSAPPSIPQPVGLPVTPSAQETEAKIRELQEQLNRLEREKQRMTEETRLKQANATLREICRIASQADEMQKQLNNQQSAIGSMSRWSGERKELQDMLVAELREFARQRELREQILPQARARAAARGQRATERREALMGRLQKLFDSGQLPGPARSLRPPVFVRPGTPDAGYLLSGKGLEPVVDRWFPGATRSDQQRQERYKKTVNSGSGLKVAPPSPILRVVEVSSVTEEQLRSVRRNLQTESRRISTVRAELNAAVAEAAALMDENKRLGQINAGKREEIKACRRAIHELETQLKEACRNHVIAAAQARAVEELERVLDKAEATKGWRTWFKEPLEDVQELVADCTCYLAALQRLKDYGDLMHRRFDPAGPMDRFFTLLKDALADSMHGKSADRLASFLAGDTQEFADGLINLSSPDAASISRIFGLTKKEESP
ncbi:MAG: hypothetical protein WCV00_18410 [Verrucomicrobiia bacterium]